MGAGASIATKPNHHHHNDNLSTHTTRSANSVRAMALKNHARQENSYIPPDRLRSKFNKNVNSAADYNSTSEPRARPKGPEVREVQKDAVQYSSPASAVGGSGSLVQFKSMMNINLKINLEDDNDWGKVRSV